MSQKIRASKNPSWVLSLLGEKGPSGPLRIMTLDGANCLKGRRKSWCLVINVWTGEWSERFVLVASNAS